MLIQISGGRVLDPARGTDEIDDLWLFDDRIIEPPTRPAEHIIDATGLWVVPGLIDLHVHLREPGGEHKEDIASGTAAAAAGGFTTVCAMPNTSPTSDSPEIIEYVRKKANEIGRCRVKPVAAVTVERAGRELTGFDGLLAAGAAALSDDGSPVATSEMLERALTCAEALGALVMDHPEDMSLSAGGAVHQGAVAARLGLPGIPASAEETCVSRDLEVAERLGARIHLQHISTQGSVELIRKAKARGVRVSAEVTPHHLIGTDELLEHDPSMVKVNPPIRSERHREALRKGLVDGTLDAIATDHAPHTLEEKNQPLERAPFGISGLESALSLCLELVNTGLITPLRLVDALSTTPSRILGCPGGTLAPGVQADVTLIDPRIAHRIDPSAWSSRGRNTPFADREVLGRTVATLLRGAPTFWCLDEAPPPVSQ